jgi:alpha-1,6-mannosyltransferase
MVGQALGACCDRATTPRSDRPLVIADLTQSYAPTGGGISTYLREKRDHVLDRTPHSLVQIVPGPVDRVRKDGRHVFVEVAAPRVPGNPHQHFILRTNAVRRILADHMPDVVESLCPWLLFWAAIRHRRDFPETTLVAGYRTDFQNAHVHRVGSDLFGRPVAGTLRDASYRYARRTYSECDRIYTLSDDARRRLASHGLTRTDVLHLGVDTSVFTPDARDLSYRRELGLVGNGPLLIYSGRIDIEGRSDRLVEMFRRLPRELDAAMVMVGDGKLRRQLEAQSSDLAIRYVGFEADRHRLARALASSDIYVSAMADETFGLAVLEAQSAGLPVVGVASGAMTDRVRSGMGLLGPVDDMDAMAENVEIVWRTNPRWMGDAARRHVAARFGWERTFDQLLSEVYPAAMDHALVRQMKRIGASSRSSTLAPTGAELPASNYA